MGIDNKLSILTIEEYNKYFDDDRFIHNIAFAHGVEGWGNDNKALCFYTIAKSDFKVSPELQRIAKEEYNKRKLAIINNIKDNELIFVGMGMDFKPCDNEHIGNHRIRTYFKDKFGVVCFVEFGTSMDNRFLRCDHAIYNTKTKNKEWLSLKQREISEKRTDLETKNLNDFEYTKENILLLINGEFETSFNDVKVFSYFVNTDDYICISKKN